MTRALQAGRVDAQSGETRSAVIFLHGYGANGADLLGLAQPLGEHLPDTMFLAPDAPEACVGSPMGLQWFPIPWIDGSSEEESRAGMLRAVDDLNAFLDGVMIDEDLLPEQVAVFGFSQGTMMALHVLPGAKTRWRRWWPFRGGFWSRSFWPMRWCAARRCCLSMAIWMTWCRSKAFPRLRRRCRARGGKRSMPISWKAPPMASRPMASRLRWLS